MRRISLPLWLVSAFLYIFLYAPIVVVIVYSFNASRYGAPRRTACEWRIISSMVTGSVLS